MTRRGSLKVNLKTQHMMIAGNKLHHIFVFLIVAVLLGSLGDNGSVVSAADNASGNYQGIIVAVGNSLTEGLGVDEAKAYPARLQRKLQAEGLTYEVINAGISGETSSGTLSRISWILKLQPDIVILETGANDGLRGIDPNLTRQNIIAAIKKLKTQNVTVILAGMQTLPNLGKEYAESFSEIYPQIAQSEEVPLIPFFLEGVAGVPELNRADGIHPTAQGYAIISESVYPYVREAIKHLTPNR